MSRLRDESEGFGSVPAEIKRPASKDVDPGQQLSDSSKMSPK